MKVISRREWGARHPDGFGPAPVPWTEWWLHHSVTIAPDLVPPWGDDDSAVRLLEDIGQQRFKGGISYTFAVTPSGRVYAGHSIGRRGAHTIGHNTTGRGIVLVGNYDRDRPTPDQLDGVAWLVADHYRRGLCRANRLTGGHRDVKGTDCPGDHAYALIPEINRRVDALLTPVPTLTPLEEIMALSKQEQAEVVAAIADAVHERVRRDYPEIARQVRDTDGQLSEWVAGEFGVQSPRDRMSLHELGQQAAARAARIERRLGRIEADVEQLRAGPGAG